MATALYTDLSSYYDLMCRDIDYQNQSDWLCRLHQLFGNEGKQHIDLACGTGPHIRHFIDMGYQCQGLDINQPMLDIAEERCPEALLTLGNMSDFSVDEPVDLISCFLYSLHYCQNIAMLNDCIKCVHRALKTGGVFCFNAVDKNTINNDKFEQHCLQHEGSQFTFTSAWDYCGEGEQQYLAISIEKEHENKRQSWQDRHSMVALSFEQLQKMLCPYFEITLFEHDYTKLVPWHPSSGNAIFACVKL
jgi:ubiquinone/menaquinone biosynthesis C-methylase UbiE